MSPLSGVKRTSNAQIEFSAFDPTTTCGNVRHKPRFSASAICRKLSGSAEGLACIERTDGDVVPVRISERKLPGSSAGIHMWLFFQPAHESACPWQSYVKVVDPEEQEEAVATLGVVATCQRGMLVGTTLVETQKDLSTRAAHT